MLYMQTMSTEFPKQVIAFPRGVEPDGSATIETEEVALTVVQYYHRYGAEVVLLPGGRSFMASDNSDGFSDGEAMRKIVIEKGVPEEKVPVLESSFDTVT